MKLQKQYSLQKLCGIPYLLPFGQNVVEHRRGIRLNDTGAFLWEELAKGSSYTELLHHMAEHYGASAEELPILKKDLDDFLAQLIQIGILIDDKKLPEPNCYFQIAGITIGYSGNPKLLMPSLNDFVCKPPDKNEWEHLQKKQHFIISATTPYHKPTGKLLIKTTLLEIIEEDECYTLLFPQQKQLMSCCISRDGGIACFYISSTPDDPELKHQLFYAFRDAFLFFAQKHGLFAIHSASILYKKKAWLFSGPSGTGKSTHTNLWKNQYHVPLLNGDLNLCSASENGITVHGMPWCGTSEIYTPGEYPLGGVALLRQAKENQIEEFSTHEKQLQVSQRLISPSWTEEFLSKNLAFSKALSEKVPVFRIACNMDNLAAETAKNYIDAITPPGVAKIRSNPPIT